MQRPIYRPFGSLVSAGANISQICEMLLHEGVEVYKKEGFKFMQRLVAKQKLRTK